MINSKVVLPGGAGLVGQNLVARLKAKGYSDILVLDKHKANIDVLKRVQPDITVEYADLAEPGDWQRHFVGADVVVMLQAQIGGNDYQEFVRNNVDSTRLILEAIKLNNVPYLVHISSSVVESDADDFYTKTKDDQEKMVLESGIPCPILRPTLMFGWFDRKHLGWLSRFMAKVPVFPVPADGRYMRQPLYVGDFSNIIISCLENRVRDGVYNISGHEKVDYIDIIREIKRATHANAMILRIPYGLFYALLWVWGLFDNNPPFTTQQLAALSAKDEFEVIDWPGIFGVPCTSFKAAIDETFNDPRYSGVVLEF
ncbi:MULTISPECIES: NAD-dependent epimerase/dehydratase family protein [unclassified Pseudomonas]|uniref:NAD-dependent epimerase/dehydratase family protein n=1 Tax=unclassified Pseudomonas TaxID=196821 RepID=UPI002AC9BAA5|nr:MULTISPECIES: NAD-dependent epimerase/dehydratase family protein [unclassified Pseudomonas]MEB0047234.1 NAD-dependent epimerase/dehydratase family protein [Pseudomonas sp. Dout3]MEB0096874.1 NAD-dependent epimerase/dehydratase family protein [Pseudomonas sp. DC1.2]WPX57386.1 NAD-dependent epimerase/dehydratase family protein [Pseudomonas sp. DC1.2]